MQRSRGYSTRKAFSVSYLNEVIEKLELKNISTIHGRAEELSRNSKYRER